MWMIVVYKQVWYNRRVLYTALEGAFVVKKLRLRRRNAWLPAWNMPSDPVKAVFWFAHWSLKVLVRYFWLLIIAGVVAEGVMNGIVGGGFTLLIGLVMWGGMAILLSIFNVFSGVARTVSQLNDLQQGFTTHNPFDRPARPDVDSSKVVEGTITDLDEERKKRRRES